MTDNLNDLNFHFLLEALEKFTDSSVPRQQAEDEYWAFEDLLTKQSPDIRTDRVVYQFVQQYLRFIQHSPTKITLSQHLWFLDRFERFWQADNNYSFDQEEAENGLLNLYFVFLDVLLRQKIVNLILLMNVTEDVSQPFDIGEILITADSSNADIQELINILLDLWALENENVLEQLQMRLDLFQEYNEIYEFNPVENTIQKRIDLLGDDLGVPLQNLLNNK